jgi:hypothetical protein
LAERIISDKLIKVIVVSDRVRPWSYQRHAAAQNVEQLRQFVDAGPSKPSADAGNPIIGRACLNC